MPAEPYLLNDMPRSIYEVIDIYDFKFNEDYKEFELNFGNNYCYAMQVMGWIQPFRL